MPSQELVRETSPQPALDPILNRWSNVGRSGLLPALVEAQEQLRWLSPETITYIAGALGVPLADAYGVADFYSHLYTHPVGHKIVRVCDDVPCFLAGSDKVCAAVEKHLSIQPGEMTADGAFTFEVVPCLGHCAHAPVLTVAEQVFENITPDKIPPLLTQT